MSKKIEEKLSKIAYDRFKELLFSKVWKPGDYISQSELVKKTGIQISPMRDALHKLSAEGLVQITPRKGIQVTPSSIKIIREVFHLRKILEKEAVIFFIENAHDDMIQNLKVAHENIVKKVNASNTSKLRELIYQGETEMHVDLMDFMGNDLISRIYKLNTDRIRLFRLDWDFTYTTKHALETLKEHLDVINSIAKRDINKAVKAMNYHINMSLTRAIGPPYM